MSALVDRLKSLARTPVLLVATDYDGTIAALTDEPGQARPNREAVAALRGLALLPHTHVAVISGRALRDLAPLSGLSEHVHLVGSHGTEFDLDFCRRLPEDRRMLLARLLSEVRKVSESENGFLVEEKPASVAFHFRKSPAEAALRAVEGILQGPGRLPGVTIKRGKSVVELCVVPSDKGTALNSLRRRVGASACFYVGDDVSDEDALAVLQGPDLGVHVGEGPSVASFRVPDASDATRLLVNLMEFRAQWLEGPGAETIERHVLLSDQRTVALLTPAARIVWYCLPRVDSSAVFSELLGGPSTGYFAVSAADGTLPLRNEYLKDSFVHRTHWPTFTVTDYLDCSGGRPFQRAGRSDLIRRVDGTGRIVIEFAPRLDYGRAPTRLAVVPDGLQVEGALDPILLRAPGVGWALTRHGPHQSATAEWDLSRGFLILELRHGLSHARELVTPEPRRREQTGRFWETWVNHLTLPDLYPELVKRSALVLKALSHGPSGALAAAATTSLPECAGGVRNWDYRFCWLRDAAMAGAALVRLGSTGQGVRLLDWLLGIIDRGEPPEALRPVYTVTGGHLGPEAEIGELPGYRGSRPVRVGNAAAHQLQLDILGAVMDLLAMLAEAGAALSAEHWRLTEAIVRAVAARWREADHGIWEIRGMPCQFVHSKVMCWAAVDRAIRVARVFSAEVPAAWVALAGQIRDDVLARGWSESCRSFVAAYDGRDLDAAALLTGITGLIAADDPRFLATVEAIQRELRHGPTVYRYRFDDGLPGREGGFHLCTAWLVESLALVGRVEAARSLLDDWVATFGPLNLASEEYCPITHQSLGNFPQAYSHVGLINAVLAVSR
jgi:trehalose-phosphatase